MSQCWVLCSDCHRVLWTSDGPTCSECLAKRAKPEPPEMVVESPECQQPMPVPKSKGKAESKGA
jgi:hypothetical protein